ncbi:enoyl-CoA hydratase/isomerase family protein [Blastomonas fulva]|uniref:enoyl-CoA hydratase/isomerase family protein n=1 Tax=Blastomonas fulva TaxID=1550728 RepID=UPI003F70B455
MGYSSLTFDIADRIGLITFTTPEKLNAISEARLADLESVLDAVEADPDIRALIITGTGNAFCVGLDLDLLDRAFDDIGYFTATVRRLSNIVTRIEALEIPTIAAINGYARAGGFEMTLGCDFCIIANEARIGDVHTDAGVVPAFVSLRLRRRVGDQRAKDILWTARWYTGPEAVDIGLALKSVPLASLVDEARAYAASITDKPRAAIAALKRIYIEGATMGVAEGTELELGYFAEYMGSQPYGREGYRAFREKRVPTWRNSA